MKQSIKKAVFPVAGLGTRFLPATKASPKEMLPIIDKPIIQYAAEEAIEAGIEELIFVTSSNKRAIEDHFDSNFELETFLKRKKDYKKLKLVKNTIPSHVTCAYVRQKSPLGLGDAVLCAEHIIGDDPFVVILADDLLEAEPKNCLKAMIDLYHEHPSSIVAVQTIDPKNSKNYGIIKPQKQGHTLHLIKMAAIVEKPNPSEAPSNLAVIGRYLLTPKIFSELRKTTYGSGHEIQLTDAIAKLIKKEDVHAYLCPNKRYDCGTNSGYLEAIFAYGLKHPKLKTHMKKLLSLYAHS